MSTPITAEAQRLLERIVPPPHRPPQLYYEIAANEAVARQLIEGPLVGLRGLLYTGQVSNAERELCILRVTARRGAAHEWGVHVAYFGAKSGLSPSQIDATASDSVVPQPPWTDRQRAVLAVADAVADVRELGSEEEALVAAELSRSERTEFCVLGALYLGIAAMCRVFRVPAEPGTPRMPGPA